MFDLAAGQSGPSKPGFCVADIEVGELDQSNRLAGPVETGRQAAGIRTARGRQVAVVRARRRRRLFGTRRIGRPPQSHIRQASHIGNQRCESCRDGCIGGDRVEGTVSQLVIVDHDVEGAFGLSAGPADGERSPVIGTPGKGKSVLLKVGEDGIVGLPYGEAG
jgi:hypothetical protein